MFARTKIIIVIIVKECHFELDFIMYSISIYACSLIEIFLSTVLT